MTEKTLTPNFRFSKKKTGEIARLVEFMEAKHLQPFDISKVSDVSERTIKNCIYDDTPIGGKLLRSLHLNFGVSLDWLLSGNGSMFCTEKTVLQPPVEGQEPGIQELVALISDWMNHATDQERTWLLVDIKQRLILNWPPLGSHHGNR